MPKKKTSKKSIAKKSTKKSPRKENVHVVMMSDFLDGDTAKSRKSLAAAVTYNKHFPQYLLGLKRFPTAPPGHYGVGDANEAAYYMNSSYHVWQKKHRVPSIGSKNISTDNGNDGSMVAPHLAFRVLPDKASRRPRVTLAALAVSGAERGPTKGANWLWYNPP